MDDVVISPKLDVEQSSRPFHIVGFADAFWSQNSQYRVRYAKIFQSLLLFYWGYDRVFETIFRENYPSFIA